MRALSKGPAALPFILSALLVSPSMAQTPPADEPPPPARQTDTPTDRFGFIEGEQLQFSTSTEEDNLTFKLALPAGPSMANRFSLTASTPFSKDENVKPASLDALANGTRVKLSWGYFDVRVGRPDDVAARLRARARARCRAKEPASNPDEDPCADSSYAMNKYDPANVAREQGHSGPGVTDYGVDASVGINEFEWLDRTSLLPQKKQHTDWSVAAHVAHYLAGSQTALTASLSYQRAYKAAEEELVCPAVTTNPVQDCKMARALAPSVDKNFLLAAGVRHRFLGSDGKLLNLAVAPLVTYDVKDDVWGVDVPVYVMPDKEGALTGGIRFGYRSDREDKFSIGVFVGTTFNILQ
ncbi:MAG TPA: hypothetical protein VFP12_05690 [Allosphingosinicella sp.]|nr:hypothetical protein [Allosphingosinicella sp.]